MRPVQPKDVDRHRCFLMYDDEPLLNLVVIFHNEPDAQEWWHIVVDLEEGGYAVGKVADLTAALQVEGKEALEKPFGEFVGDVLTPVSVILEMHEADMDQLRDETYATPSQVAVLLEDGEFRGIIPVGGTRSSGAFDGGLLKMAGKYADIPSKSLLSARRKAKRGVFDSGLTSTKGKPGNIPTKGLLSDASRNTKKKE